MIMKGVILIVTLAILIIAHVIMMQIEKRDREKRLAKEEKILQSLGILPPEKKP